MSLFRGFFKTIKKKVVRKIFLNMIFGSVATQTPSFQNPKKICAEKI